MQTTSSNIAGRALLAVALFIGFYVLAIAIAALLFYIPIAEVSAVHRIHVKIALFCWAGGVIILWSILPRRDKFTPPGPALSAGDHPRLHAQIRSIASRVGEKPPREVYLVADTNAWVAERGGIMGIGSRRVMALGLPLMQVLSVDELRAVLAHEFGHYHGGDTKLGPWIYKTRAAIGRTLHGLAQHSSTLMAPFEWYGNMFLKVTSSVSRHQEFVADRVASNAVSAAALANGLRKIHGLANAFDVYFKAEVVPVLGAGFFPPLAAGFGLFVSAPSIREQINGLREKALEHLGSDAYDSHPPLAQRLAAIGQRGAAIADDDSPCAVSLLGNLDGTERRLLMHATGNEAIAGHTATEWETVAATVLLPGWKKFYNAHSDALMGVTIDSLPTLKDRQEEFQARIRATLTDRERELDVRQAQRWLIACALVTLYVERGWNLRSAPGTPITLRSNGDTLEPFVLADQIDAGNLDPAKWQEDCRRWQVSGTDLGGLNV